MSVELENTNTIEDLLGNLALLDTGALWDIRLTFEKAKSQEVRELGTRAVDTMISFLQGLEASEVAVKHNVNALALSVGKNLLNFLMGGGSILSMESFNELMDVLGAMEYLRGARPSIKLVLAQHSVEMITNLKEILVRLYKANRDEAHRMLRDLILASERLSKEEPERATSLLLLIGSLSIALALRLTK